jgi:L-threonylcarbamoyladenylate synthase
MRTIKWTEAADPQGLCDEVRETLVGGGLACIPCGGRYRLLADLTNEEAVLALMQSKGRVREAPALVFISGEDELGRVAAEVEPLALALARRLWPQPLTIRVKPNPDLPAKVLKQLGGARGRIGVRVPSDALARAILARVGRPLLVSSANREHKAGASSPAQVRKTFGARVDVFIDRGDLVPEAASTVIDVRDGAIVITRAGAVSAEVIQAAADGGAQGHPQ